MDYKLAKKLRKAGFNQDTANVARFSQYRCPQTIGAGNIWCKPECPDKVYVPSLSELIEACGDKLFELYDTANKENPWQASVMVDLETFERLFSHGKTPEEAVAKLWLKLNKK